VPQALSAAASSNSALETIDLRIVILLIPEAILWQRRCNCQSISVLLG
jgi:hypothetical protein